MAVFAVMVVLWWSSSRSPGAGAPSLVGDLIHNAMHLVAFGGLAAASWCACRLPARGAGGRSAALFAVAIAVGYGVVDELHQGWVPGRVCSAYDVLTDACGACACVWLLRILQCELRPVAWHGVLLAMSAMASVTLATLA